MTTDQLLINKITLPHLAFAKGWVNGLDLRDLAERYLAALGDDEGDIDLRVVKGTLSRVLRELANAAARNGVQGSAVLFRQASRIRADASPPGSEEAPPRPTFDEFLRGVDGADEFSNEELLEAYNNRYPASTKSDVQAERALARRARLIDRQLKLIARLEPLAAAPIKLTDRIVGWFDPSVAARIEAAGFSTIQDLWSCIASNPKGWFDTVRGVGAGKAQRIERFLRSQLGDLPVPQLLDPVYAPAPGSLASTAINLDTLHTNASRPPLPSSLPGNEHLDGSRGRLRDQVNASAIQASNDYEAMKTWLSLKRNAQTVALYEREVTRLIAWSIQVKGKALSSLTLEDAVAYRDFLAKGPDQAHLISKGPRKTSPGVLVEMGVIPVAGFTKAGLKTSTIKKALVIIGGFFTWLTAVRYVTANPFTGITADQFNSGVGLGSVSASDEAGLTHAKERRSTVRERVLPQGAIDAVMDYLSSPADPGCEGLRARERFVFLFTLGLGLRISEVSAARRADLEYIPADSSSGFAGGWLLHVLGKRDKPREVPFPDHLIQELAMYLMSRGLLTRPDTTLPVSDGTFLVGALPSFTATSKPEGSSKRLKENADGVRSQTIHLTLKGVFKKAFASSAFKDVKLRERLLGATAHWLRHTAATQFVATDVPLDVVASNLGHADISTTSIYIHAERTRKMEEMRRLWAKRLPAS